MTLALKRILLIDDSNLSPALMCTTRGLRNKVLLNLKSTASEYIKQALQDDPNLAGWAGMHLPGIALGLRIQRQCFAPSGSTLPHLRNAHVKDCT